jgi:hypothetical protein
VAVVAKPGREAGEVLQADSQHKTGKASNQADTICATMELPDKQRCQNYAGEVDG